MNFTQKHLKLVLALTAGFLVYFIFLAKYLYIPASNLLNSNVIGIWSAEILIFFLLTSGEIPIRVKKIKINRKSLLSLLIVLAAAFILRFYDLTNIPPGVHGDEGEWGLIELGVLNGKFKEFFSLAQQGIYFDFSILSFTTQAIFLKIFGANLLGVRASSAFAGTLSLIPFYLLAKEWLSKRSAFLASFVLAFSHWTIAYSRLGISNIWTVFWELWFFFFLFKGLKENSRLFFSLAGIFLGLGLYFHHTFKVIPAILAIFFLFLLIKERKQFFKRILPLACFFIMAALIFFPQLIYYWQNPGSFTARLDEISVFNHLSEYQNKYQTSSSLIILITQFSRTIGVFIRGGDIGFFFYGYQGALIDIVSLVFIAIGLLSTFFNLKKNESFLILTWLLAVIILGGTFTIDAPSSQRLIGLAPALFLLAGFGGEKILAFSRSRKMKNYFLGASMILIALLNYNVYFSQYIQSDAGWAQKEPATAIAKYLLSLGESFKVYMLREENPILYFHHGTIRFLAPKIQGVDVGENTLDYIPAKNEINHNLVYIMPPGSKFLPYLKKAYPFGQEHLFINPYNGRPWFTSYEVRQNNYNIDN